MILFYVITGGTTFGEEFKPAATMIAAILVVGFLTE
jgi:hypothetical protein